ncbi:MAG: SH3 domain-containing protein [Oscillochloris sp.]|nr:SH3 domain-containing protein [Oscillochloris sp.]
MPPKADPRDWERLFRPNAPRRGGPVRAFVNVLLSLLIVILIGGVLFLALLFGLDTARERTAEQAATMTAAAERVFIGQTTTVIADTTATSIAATTLAVTPTAEPEPAAIGVGSVLNGGNLRSEPAITPETVIGQVCPGDAVRFLEQITLDDGTIWFRIRVTESGPSCSPQQVTIGSEGWASATLLSELTP